MKPCLAIAFSCLIGGLAAQRDSITEQRVRDTVSWLADDARAGRDTGSVEIEQSAQWIADRFDKAGLHKLGATWWNDFTVPGQTIDSGAVALTLHRLVDDKVEDVHFVAGKDVRQYTPSDALEGDAEACTVAKIDDPVLQRQLGAASARRPILIEVAESHPYWQAAAGVHQVISRGRRRESRPILLVREGLLPANPADGREVQWTATWRVAAQEKVEVTQHNVVAMIPGTTKKDDYVMVSAHYDHIGRSTPVNGDSINNGADDDASGTTAVILIAEAMAKMPPPARNVLFVCFAAEERGLVGSAAFAEKPPVPLDHLFADLNIEMIGRPLPGNEGKAWITGDDLSDFATIGTAALARADVSLVDFQMAGMLFAQSDNFSLARKGVVAHSISAGSLHEDYHRPSDEVKKLDLPHMTKITRGLLEFTLELANRDEAPKWNDKGKARIERSQR